MENSTLGGTVQTPRSDGAYSLLLYRLAKPWADSPISYAFSFLWL